MAHLFPLCLFFARREVDSLALELQQKKERVDSLLARMKVLQAKFDKVRERESEREPV